MMGQELISRRADEVGSPASSGPGTVSEVSSMRQAYGAKQSLYSYLMFPACKITGAKLYYEQLYAAVAA
jgi:hypothetical protein